MNPNVSYNPDVGQTNQSALAYTTSGELNFIAKNDLFQGLTREQKAEAKMMLEMLVNDIENHVKNRMQGSANVRY